MAPRDPVIAEIHRIDNRMRICHHIQHSAMDAYCAIGRRLMELEIEREDEGLSQEYYSWWKRVLETDYERHTGIDDRMSEEMDELYEEFRNVHTIRRPSRRYPLRLRRDQRRRQRWASEVMALDLSNLPTAVAHIHEDRSIRERHRCQGKTRTATVS